MNIAHAVEKLGLPESETVILSSLLYGYSNHKVTAINLRDELHARATRIGIVLTTDLETALLLRFRMFVKEHLYELRR